MAVYKEVQTDDGVVAERPVATTETRTADERPVTTERAEYGMNLAARIIYFIGSVVIILLILRFLLALLGANPLNGFANFIYSVTRPLVAPFTSLFNYYPSLGKAHFELTTLVAIIVYGLLTVLLAKLATIGSRRPA